MNIRNYLSVVVVCATVSTGAAPHAPFPVQPLARGADWRGESAWNGAAACVVSAEKSDDLQARVMFLHDIDALYLNCVARDDSVTTAPSEAVAPGECRLYEYDSMEFWIGRHQFTVGVCGDKVLVYDYLRNRIVVEAETVSTNAASGYTLRSRIPWKALEFEPAPRKSLQIAIQINDVDMKDGARSRATLFAPKEMQWDKPASYGAAFLNDTIPVDQCATTLEPFCLPEVETGAFIDRTRLILRPNAFYGTATFRIKATSPKGEELYDGSAQVDATPLLIDLPTGKTPGICRLELSLMLAAGLFGPVTMEYFSPGDKPLRDYRGTKEPPTDFDAFWDARLAELAKTAMEPLVETLPRSTKDVELLQVKLKGWRGVKFIAYASVPRGEGKYPLSLWVYPASPIKPEEIQLRTDCVTLSVNPRGIGASAALSAPPKALYVADIEDPADFYPAANFLDIIRGIDFAVTLPKVDSKRIFVGGGSRGGYLTFALAALDKRITLASAGVPCYSDVDLMGRIGYSSAAGDAYHAMYGGTPERQTSMRHVWQYFDTVNFAHRITCPIIVEAGMLDTICPAPGIVEAYNRIASKEKVFLLNPEHGHSGTEVGGFLRRLLERNSIK